MLTTFFMLFLLLLTMFILVAPLICGIVFLVDILDSRPVLLYFSLIILTSAYVSILTTILVEILNKT